MLLKVGFSAKNATDMQVLVKYGAFYFVSFSGEKIIVYVTLALCISYSCITCSNNESSCHFLLCHVLYDHIHRSLYFPTHECASEMMEACMWALDEGPPQYKKLHQLDF